MCPRSPNDAAYHVALATLTCAACYAAGAARCLTPDTSRWALAALVLAVPLSACAYGLWDGQALMQSTAGLTAVVVCAPTAWWAQSDRRYAAVAPTSASHPELEERPQQARLVVDTIDDDDDSAVRAAPDRAAKL